MEDTDGWRECCLDGDVEMEGGKLPSLVGPDEWEGCIDGCVVGIALCVGLKLGCDEGQ